jgi:hypothetical protein
VFDYPDSAGARASSGHSARRLVDPPLPVLVDLRLLFGPTRPRWGIDTPLWARTAGLCLDQVPAVVTEWWLTQCGDWAAVCQVSVQVDQDDVTVTMVVPAWAMEQGRDGRDGPGG